MAVVSAEILASAAGPEGFPPPERPEVAIVGRSNVGKSSLLNRMVGRRQLARTSGTPGKTRMLHFYRVRRREGELALVDLPGYGYARVSKAERRSWRGLVEGYLGGREVLRAVVLLHDVRRDPGEDETDLLAWLAERRIPVLVALTKVDKLNRRERTRRLATLRTALPVQADWLLATSARTGEGTGRLWEILDGIL